MSQTFQTQPLLHYATRIFEACGAPYSEAVIVAEHLVSANMLGYDTHGVVRIPQYVEDCRSGTIRPGAPIQLEKETETTAVVNCNWNFGQVGGLRAVQTAIDKASRFNTATVVVRRCNHAGRLGSFTQYAAGRGMIAIAVCNSPRHGHFVLPWGGREGRLATNPISFAAPCDSGFPLLADFSTAEISEGAIRLCRNQGASVPEGSIVDHQGCPSTDPNDFYGPPRGGILPFGGTKGYRGYALGLLVEIVGGILGGSSILAHQPGNGLGMIVINVEAFMPMSRFSGLMQELREYVKSSQPAPGFDEVLLPGEPDQQKLVERSRNGIPIDENTWEQIVTAGESVGVSWPRRTKEANVPA